MDLDSIVKTLQNYQPVTAPNTPHSAAVLILLMFDDENNFSLLVTKRSETVATYVGDYCFPGGMKELSDSDLQFTALRETQEELNLSPEHYQIIGQLDDFYDHYHSLVRPFVAVIAKKEFMALQHYSSEEIAELFYFSLEDLRLINRDETMERLSKRHPTYSYRQGNVLIWGLTASIMVLLGNILFGLDKPVAKRRDDS
ncbi:MAG: CoA pyrophosphatase [Pseudomonadota bacterium]